MVEQLLIAVCGGVAVFLVGCRGPVRRYGFLLGLLAQPAWIYSAWKAEQWGILALSVWYTFAWARGLKSNWCEDEKL